MVLVFVVVPVFVFVLVPVLVFVLVPEDVPVVVLVVVPVVVPVAARVVSLRGTVVSFTLVVPEVSVSTALAPSVTGTLLRPCSDQVPSLLLTCPSRDCDDPLLSRGAAG